MSSLDWASASVNQPQAVKYDSEVRARKLHLGWRRIQTQFYPVDLLKAEAENITPRPGNYGLQQGGREKGGSCNETTH